MGNGPDIVLMDIQMPRMSGVQATAVLTTSDSAARVIILTTFDYEDYVFDVIKAGAMGYLLKDVPADELMATIRQVYAETPNARRSRVSHAAPGTPPGLCNTGQWPSSVPR